MIFSNSTINCMFQNKTESLVEFSDCYNYFFQQKITASLLSAFLIAGIISSNIQVAILIIKNNKKDHLNVFDKILISHAIVNGLAGLVLVPFYHVYILFDYWPFDQITAKIWITCDNCINIVTTTHTLYMCWSRLRCVQQPVTFKNELLIRNPLRLILTSWVISFVIWTPFVYFTELEEHSIDFKYNNLTYTLITYITCFLFWLFPLCCTFILCFFIFYYLKIGQTRRLNLHSQPVNHIETKKSLFEYVFGYNLSTQSVFIIIMSIHWFQWFIPCVIRLIEFFYDTHLDDGFYWLTYTVCLTDPLVLLIFNPNLLGAEHHMNSFQRHVH